MAPASFIVPPGCIDLTVNDPTACGFVYEQSLYAPLTDEEPSRYRPASLGVEEARLAIAAYYEARGVTISPERIWLGSGTSELFLQALWLVADPGDSILTPAPGYPLHEMLAKMADTRPVEYALHYDAGWHIDRSSIEAAWCDANVAACCVVSPSNPAGLYLDTDSRACLEGQCTERGAALIVDEVFADYPLRDGANTFFAATEPSCLSFVLSGLSKVAALPQMKLGWGVVLGPDKAVGQALARLEQIADAFLSVSTPLQRALPRLLEASTPMQKSIRRRCRENFELLREAAGRGAFGVYESDGGWNAVLRLPQLPGWDDTRWTETLCCEQGVATQPGYLFNLADPPPHLVVSLLVPSPTFRVGVARLSEGVDHFVGAG